MATNLKCNNCDWQPCGDEGAIRHVENNPEHVITGETNDGDTITIGFYEE